MRFADLNIGDRFVFGRLVGHIDDNAKKIKTGQSTYDLYFLNGDGPFKCSIKRKISPLVTKINK